MAKLFEELGGVIRNDNPDKGTETDCKIVDFRTVDS